MKRFDKPGLLICDEWGYVPIDSDGSKLLFQVVSECYERKSLIVTANLEFARWNDIFADTKITAALPGRIIHHSHLPDFSNRESRRLRHALQFRSPLITSYFFTPSFFPLFFLLFAIDKHSLFLCFQ
jgi:DNA replication protein DnaC